MADKTWDIEDSVDLSYDFAYSKNTDRVYVVAFGGRGLGVSMMFLNRPAFHRFLIEGNKTDSLIADPIPDHIKDITGGG